MPQRFLDYRYTTAREVANLLIVLTADQVGDRKSARPRRLVRRRKKSRGDELGRCYALAIERYSVSQQRTQPTGRVLFGARFRVGYAAADDGEGLCQGGAQNCTMSELKSPRRVGYWKRPIAPGSRHNYWQPDCERSGDTESGMLFQSDEEILVVRHLVLVGADQVVPQILSDDF